jgi:asparagine synthase (glutamine-hydrolysing)
LGGRFSIAIIDDARKRALLAVDQMGIEHVAFALHEGILVFGKSAETVAHFSERVAAVDPQAIFDYLVLHMVPAPGTIFRGVRKLRPGYCVTFENGRTSERRYWTARFTTQTHAEFGPLKADLYRTIREAVRDCAPDAETGAFLSGGLDSSTVAGFLSEVGPKPTKTFTIGFGYGGYDELPYSRTANTHFGCEAHEYVVTGDDIADGFPKIAQAYDEPFGNSSALPVYYCAKLAVETGMEHLLAGDGGDELFAGNARYAEQQIFERYRHVPQFVRRGLIEPVLAAWPDVLQFWLIRRGRGYVEKANVSLPTRLEMWNLLHRAGTENLLHPDFRASINEGGTLNQMQALWDSAPADSTLGHMLYYDWQYTLSDNDLRKVETMSSLAGLRVSYPLLHPDVVELSMRIPPSLLMPGMKLRDFYKRAMQGFLPDAIIHKKKHGFGLPFGLWLRETPRLREQIDGNLAALRSRRIIRAEFIDHLLQLHGQDDAEYYGVFIWVLAMLEQWLTEHQVNV